MERRVDVLGLDAFVLLTHNTSRQLRLPFLLPIQTGSFGFGRRFFILSW